MFFLRLGLLNAYRNLTRSSIAIFAMFIAGAFLTFAVSLSRGYPHAIKKDYRAVMGGEIIVYEMPFADIELDNDHTWVHKTLVSSPLTDLEIFHPQLFQQGYFSKEMMATHEPKDWRDDTLVESPLDLTSSLDGHMQGSLTLQYFSDDVLTSMEEWPGIKEVYPRYQLPALLLTTIGSRKAPLHGRDFELDQKLTYGPADLIVEGRWFTDEDDGEPVAVISSHQNRDDGERPLQIGESIIIQLPRVVYHDGEMAFDYLQPVEKSLVVIGVIEAQTRLVSSPHFRPGDVYTQVYWQLNEIQIPLGTWQKLWQEMDGAMYHPEQLMLMTEDTSYLEDMVKGLQMTFPEHTFISVPEQAVSAEKQRLIETFFPASWSTVEIEETQIVYQPNERLMLAWLIFGNAALIVAANLLIMVEERKKEIGVLKSVGAKRVEIIQMILCEAVLIAGMGAGSGYLLYRVPEILNQMTNNIALTVILSSFASDLLYVTLFTAGLSLIFGFIPAFRTARLSVMEVFRNE